MARRNNTVQKRPDNKKRNSIIIAVVVVVLAIIGTVWFTLQNQRNNASTSSPQSQMTRQLKDLGLTNKKLTDEEMAALIVTYGNKHENSAWSQAYENRAEGINIVKNIKLQFGSYDIEAPKGGQVFGLSSKAGYVVYDKKLSPESQITFVSNKGKGKTLTFEKILKQVHQDSSKSKVQGLVKDIEISSSSKLPDEEDKESESEASQDAWTSSQETKLASFMSTFGDKMDQNYDEYTGDTTIKTSAGQSYPTNLNKVKFDGDKINIGWDPELKKDYDYHVVSVFNFNDDDHDQHITYLFVVHDGKPIAMVDQSSGSSYEFKETANKYVREAFSDIWSGGDFTDSMDDIDNDD